jgi:type IV pilus assembly protein PilC
MSAAIYHYTARSEEGAAVAGTMRAGSQREVVVHLRARGLFVTSLDSAGTARGRVRSLLRFGGSRRNATAALMRSLAELIASGVPLRRAISALLRQCSDRRLKDALAAIAADLDAGCALSESMQSRPGEFSDEIVALVGAGELGGILDDACARAASIMEREIALRKRIFATLAYPAVVMIAACALMAFLLVVTVPAFASILMQLHASLPVSTILMLDASSLLRRPAVWPVIAIIAGGAIVAGGSLRSQPSISAWIDAQLLRVPLLGALQRHANAATFCRTLGTLLHCGVVMTAAAKTSAGAVRNAAFRTRALNFERQLATGSTLAPLLEQSRLFDAASVQMAYVGEESGSLDAMLLHIADHHDADAQHRLTMITAMLEPAMILVLGAVIGTIVGSILVPLYSAIGNVH